jgi:hypothetical protein
MIFFKSCFKRFSFNVLSYSKLFLFLCHAWKYRVVLSDVLGSKDVVEGRDGQTDGRTRRIVIGRIRVKTELHAQIRFYALSLVNTVG